MYAWEKAIQMAVEKDVLIVTFSEAADLFRRASVSRFYNDIAKDWNRVNRQFYRTKRFQEMIRTEAEKMTKPVIADLGCGGGLLSCHLQDHAGKIYCVDNASGMVADLDSCILETRVGEVTDSGLPENLVDFVICVRIIEYIFWPDRIRHYFTPKEITEWASQIGPGHLYGVQY